MVKEFRLKTFYTTSFDKKNQNTHTLKSVHRIFFSVHNSDSRRFYFYTYINIFIIVNVLSLEI